MVRFAFHVAGRAKFTRVRYGLGRRSGQSGDKYGSDAEMGKGQF